MKLTKKKLSIIINAALILLCAACIIGAVSVTKTLNSQYEYKRWQGDNEMAFAQISVFLPDSSTVGMSQINTFRSNMMTAFKEASIESDNLLFIDAWSCTGSAKVASDRANTTAAVTAVGGNFFSFHPLTLLSGNYISENDVSPDTVVIDEELAWLLYGSSDVTGMTLRIGSGIYTVAGVVDRNDDFATKKAYTGGLGLFMNYDAYCGLVTETAAADNPVSAPGITCYEVCLPDPVKDFAINLVQSKFPASGGEIISNSGRYSFSKLMGIAKNFASRAISGSVSYPYWENAARYTENKAALLVVLALLFAVCPLVTGIICLAKLISRGSEKMSEDVMPSLKEKTEEKIRVRQRKRWEKQHNKNNT